MPNNYKLKYLVIICVMITGYFILYYFPASLSEFVVCPIKRVFGIPCPSCGSTRATILLLKGEFMQSLQLNPLAILSNSLFLVSIIWMMADLVTNKKTFIPFLKKDAGWLVKIMIFVIMAANWVWNIEKGL